MECLCLDRDAFTMLLGPLSQLREPYTVLWSNLSISPYCVVKRLSLGRMSEKQGLGLHTKLWEIGSMSL